MYLGFNPRRLDLAAVPQADQSNLKYVYIYM